MIIQKRWILFYTIQRRKYWGSESLINSAKELTGLVSRKERNKSRQYSEPAIYSINSICGFTTHQSWKDSWGSGNVVSTQKLQVRNWHFWPYFNHWYWGCGSLPCLCRRDFHRIRRSTGTSCWRRNPGWEFLRKRQMSQQNDEDRADSKVCPPTLEREFHIDI